MVFVNSKKFACEACIKGHRSSSCSHTDRPLFEVKKKGRPVSQCERCRELRQSKKVHSKCNCNPKEQRAPKPQAPPGQKPPRFVPIAPALPNGIKDVIRIKASSSLNPRQRVDTLLNPCSCGNPAWKCQCRKPVNSSNPHPNSTLNGLHALSEAAQLCCAIEPSPIPSKFKNHSTHSHNTPGPELPPFLFDTSSSPPPADTIPDFGTMPPIKEIASIAGSGCTCGVECTCPGCVEHRGAEYADADHQNQNHDHGHDGDHAHARDPCGTCVDNRQGIALPDSSISSLDPRYTSSRMIDEFFARAASLPPPPANRKMGIGIKLDPGNVMVYPSAAMETKERGVPFGLIRIPKLECCGGRCGCPTGDCSCGKACDGCCVDHLHSTFNASSTSHVTQSEVSTFRVIAPAVQSCCSNK
ncbi:hypothetical protein FB446DRAFT_692514 [Lentinula raphanica]|nr:hypothetical protein FB446DRAFT_692514 [Lentinula raphanica]